MTDSKEQEIFNRRVFLLGGIQGVLFTSLIGRMYMLQIQSTQHYQKLSDKNRIQPQLLLPQRGIIYDRHGEILATNKTTYNASIMRLNKDILEETLNSLKTILNLSDDEVKKIHQLVKAQPKHKSVVFKDHLNWNELAQLQLHLIDLKGISIDERSERFYPHPIDMAHVMGYVSSVNENERDDSDLLSHPDFRIGKSGLEKYFENTLQGKAGVRYLEVDAHRRIVRNLETQQSIAGSPVTTSISLPLQKKISDVLSIHESASAVVMNVHSGEVLGMVSSPGYDINMFINGISHLDWTPLQQNPYAALVNKVVAGQYSPASTFKMVVALAGLESGIVKPHTSVHCSGHVWLGNHKFHCWRKGGHGTVNIRTAIAGSCDTYFYEIASMIGVDAIADMAHKLGLGDITGIEIPGEKKGLIPSTSWKQKIFKSSWHKGETFNVGIGQGAVLTTPIQLAVMISRLVNGGFKIKPTLLKNTQEDIKNFLANENNKIGLDEKNLKIIEQSMNDVVNSPWGTAYQFSTPSQELQMGGKTGTSQVQRITAADRSRNLKNHQRPWIERDHGLFVGYAPRIEPKFGISIVIDHGGGGTVAAKAAKEILTFCLKELKV